MTSKIIQILIIIAIPLLFIQCKEKTKTSVEETNDYQLVWSDEFDIGTMPDTTKWNYRTGDGCPKLCGFGIWPQRMEVDYVRVYQKKKEKNNILSKSETNEKQGIN